jgi:hypothetical protein
MRSHENIPIDTYILVVRPALLAHLSKYSIRKLCTFDVQLERWQNFSLDDAVAFLPLCSSYSNREDFF